MFGKLERSWKLCKQSFAVLRSDTTLLVLPMLSAIAGLLVLASFALPMFFAVDWKTVFNSSENGGEVRMQWWYYVVMFGFYFANFFVMTFFNSALVACAIKKFKGEPGTVGDGLRTASACLPQILAWAAVAATVGVILQAIQERLGIVGKFVMNLIGMVWTIATFFVVPVLVVERVGPFDAIKRSVEVLKKTWGESLVSNVGLSAATSLIVFAGIFLFGAIAITGAVMNMVWLAILAGALLLLFLMATILISTTLKGILLAATYQYAATGEVPAGFDGDTLRSAFKLKGS